VTNTIAIVPVRGLNGGKSRLSPLLDDAERATLIASMARHVVAQVLESSVSSRILLVTRERDLLAMLDMDSPMVEPVLQRHAADGLNAAIDLGRRVGIGHAADRLIVLSGDLPLLQPSELVDACSSTAEVTIAPDRLGTGTNAIVLQGSPALDRYRFHFGELSRGKHMAEAERLGLSATEIRLPGIASDLDTPEDWHMLSVETRQRLITPSAFTRLFALDAIGTNPMAILEHA
jgi:2-phospho-L-lactate guanylyltransferase